MDAATLDLMVWVCAAAFLVCGAIMANNQRIAEDGKPTYPKGYGLAYLMIGVAGVGWQLYRLL